MSVEIMTDNVEVGWPSGQSASTVKSVPILIPVFVLERIHTNICHYKYTGTITTLKRIKQVN